MLPTGKHVGSPLRWAALSLSLLLGTTPVMAADITDVIDAMDKDVFQGVEVDDPYDFNVDVTFNQTIERAKITREWNCRAAGSTRCADGDSVLFNKELRYERTRSQLDLDFEAAIYKDLSLHVKVPIVFSDQRQLKYARNGGDACRFELNDEDPKCVDDSNSTVDPSDARVTAAQNDMSDSNPFNTYRYFDLAYDPNSPDEWTPGPDRGGLGDITFGLNWAILNDTRYVQGEDPWGYNHGRATLLIGMDYTAPTGEVARGDNEGVGEGVHWLSWRIATSRRWKYVEPYMQFKFNLGIPASDTLFKDFEGGQERIGPGPRGGITVGMEIIPWENMTPEYQQFFRIDVRGHYDFIGEGREYGPLFDHLAGTYCNDAGNNTVAATRPDASNPNPNAACGWMTEKWANAGLDDIAKAAVTENEYDPNHPFGEDGITSYEAYGRFGAGLRFVIQPIQYVQIQLYANMDVAQEHFITFGKAGKDQRGRADDPSDSCDPAVELGCATIPSFNAAPDGTVSFDDVTERNPVYNPTYDAVGRRFRAEEFTIFDWGASLILQF